MTVTPNWRLSAPSLSVHTSPLALNSTDTQPSFAHRISHAGSPLSLALHSII